MTLLYILFYRFI